MKNIVLTEDEIEFIKGNLNRLQSDENKKELSDETIWMIVNLQRKLSSPPHGLKWYQYLRNFLNRLWQGLKGVNTISQSILSVGALVIAAALLWSPSVGRVALDWFNPNVHWFKFGQLKQNQARTKAVKVASNVQTTAEKNVLISNEYSDIIFDQGDHKNHIIWNGILPASGQVLRLSGLVKHHGRAFPTSESELTAIVFTKDHCFKVLDSALHTQSDSKESVWIKAILRDC